MSYQFIQIAQDSWDCYCLNELWKNALEYRAVARVIKDGKLYYIDYAKYTEKGRDWVRYEHGFVLPIGAFRAIEQSNKEHEPRQRH